MPRGGACSCRAATAPHACSLYCGAGAGKSSIAAALFRLCELRAGAIRIDGIDIASVALHTLRQRLAVVSQDPVLFSGPLIACTPLNLPVCLPVAGAARLGADAAVRRPRVGCSCPRHGCQRAVCPSRVVQPWMGGPDEFRGRVRPSREPLSLPYR
jgi:hypothetical protein